jgi:hypothetical protein
MIPVNQTRLEIPDAGLYFCPTENTSSHLTDCKKGNYKYFEDN